MKKKSKSPRKFEKALRDAAGRFLKGTPGGPGRPPLPLELEALRAICGVMTPQTWQEIATQMREKALEGDWAALGWLEKRALGDATLAELHKLEAAPATAPPGGEKGLRELSESVLRESLVSLETKIRAGRQLSASDSELMVRIAEVLNEARGVDKAPDLSGIPTDRIEEALLGGIAPRPAGEKANGDVHPRSPDRGPVGPASADPVPEDEP